MVVKTSIKTAYTSNKKPLLWDVAMDDMQKAFDEVRPKIVQRHLSEDEAAEVCLRLSRRNPRMAYWAVSYV